MVPVVTNVNVHICVIMMIIRIVVITIVLHFYLYRPVISPVTVPCTLAIVTIDGMVIMPVPRSCNGCCRSMSAISVLVFPRCLPLVILCRSGVYGCEPQEYKTQGSNDYPFHTLSFTPILM